VLLSFEINNSIVKNIQSINVKNEVSLSLWKTGLINLTQLRQAANDTCHKTLILNQLKSQPELVEGGIFKATGSTSSP
jgi:hypothetical protein